MDSYRVNANVYDNVYDSLLTIPPHMLLACAEYGEDFVRHTTGPNNNWDYNDTNTDISYETILVGEIRPALCGTRFSAKGTHFIGSAANVCVHFNPCPCPPPLLY